MYQQDLSDETALGTPEKLNQQGCSHQLTNHTTLEEGDGSNWCCLSASLLLLLMPDKQGQLSGHATEATASAKE